MRAIACVLGAVVTAAALANAGRGQATGDRASIDAFYQEWMGTAARQGPDAYASFYAPDGQLLPPNDRPVTGRAAIAEWQRRAQAQAPYVVQPKGVVVDEVRFLDDRWVIYRGTLTGQRAPRAGGAPTPFETKYFDVLHRADDGRWQVVYRMWSDNLMP
jgi:uncharacterized protein (TIGR02246 family)